MKITEQIQEQIIQLHSEGLKNVEIAKIIGCSNPTVGNILMKNGLKNKRKYEKHGLSNHPLCQVWYNKIRYCENPNDEDYENYGKRGITICDEWRNSIIAFYNWCIKNGWKKGLQIDRIDNDGNYCPENCRFVTAFDNMHNQGDMQRNNTSGYRCVYWVKRNKKWLARIIVRDITHGLKLHNTKKEALEVLNKFIIDNNLEDLYSIQEYYGE